jgi:hypothetical protein
MAKKDWEKKKERINNWEGDYWENKGGDIIKLDWVQDRDGKNAFMHKAEKIDLSSIGTARGKKTIIASGRNEKLVLKKAIKYMMEN